MTRGRGGVRIPPKNDDVIYEQPLRSHAISDNLNRILKDQRVLSKIEQDIMGVSFLDPDP